METVPHSRKFLKRYIVTKHSWRGKYKRLLCIAPEGCATFNPANWELTNAWLWNSSNDDGTVEHLTAWEVHKEPTKFILHTKKKRSDRKSKEVELSFENRSLILSDLCRVYGPHPSLPVSAASEEFRALKITRTGDRRECILKTTTWALVRLDPHTRYALCIYPYHEMKAIAGLQEDAFGFIVINILLEQHQRQSILLLLIVAFVLTFFSVLVIVLPAFTFLLIAIVPHTNERLHGFLSDDRERILKAISNQSTNHVRATIALPNSAGGKPAMNMNDYRLKRLGNDFEDQSPLAEFPVLKLSHHHCEVAEPDNYLANAVPRVMSLTPKLLIERDPMTHTPISARALNDVISLYRCTDDAQLFAIEYRDGSVRQYSATRVNRDMVLSSLLETAQNARAGDACVFTINISNRLSHFRAMRIAPQTDFEAVDLTYLTQAIDLGMDSDRALVAEAFIDFLVAFNRNIPFNGPRSEDDKICKLTAKALIRLVDIAYDPRCAIAVSAALQEIKFSTAAQCLHLQAIRRLLAHRGGFECVHREVGLCDKLLEVLWRRVRLHDDSISANAADCIAALMSPQFDVNLYGPEAAKEHRAQEQYHKNALMAEISNWQPLLTLMMQHAKSGTGTGTLLLTNVLDALTFALCEPFSETTNAEHFSALLQQLADCGRALFQLLNYPNLSVSRCVSMLLRALIEESNPETRKKMQYLALVEGAMLKNLLLAMFLPSSSGKPDRVLLTQRLLSRRLIALFASGNAIVMKSLSQILPAGLVAYLNSSETPPPDPALANGDPMISNPRLRKVSLLDKAASVFGKKKPLLQPVQIRQRTVPGSWEEAVSEGEAKPVTIELFNFSMLFHQATQDHLKPDLIWNARTRDELKEALETELRMFDHERDLNPRMTLSWNHTEFEVRYPSLDGELFVNGYFLRLLLEARRVDDVLIRHPTDVFDDLYHKFILDTNLDIKVYCARSMASIYSRHHETIGQFRDTHRLVAMLQKTTVPTVRDALLKLIDELMINRENASQIIAADGINVLVDLLTLVHLQPQKERSGVGGSLSTFAKNTLMITGGDSEKLEEREWYYLDPEGKEGRDGQVGPLGLSDLDALFKSGKITHQSMLWAPGLDEYTRLDRITQLRWMFLAAPHANPAIGKLSYFDMGLVILSIFHKMCKLYPSRDAEGACIRPLPKARRHMTSSTCLPHIVQVLLTFDPALVERSAALLEDLARDNPGLSSRLYLSGVFFFALLYPGSNVLSISHFLKTMHCRRAVTLQTAAAAGKAAAASQEGQAGAVATPVPASVAAAQAQMDAEKERDDLQYENFSRDIMANTLPEAMIRFLEAYTPDKFAECFLGNFNTPEAIWNNDMRRLMIEKIALHLGTFPSRLLVNVRATYSYLPMNRVPYPELEDEIFCDRYYLRTLCDMDRFGEWPIVNHVELLKCILLAWKAELEAKGPGLSEDDALTSLGLPVAAAGEKRRQFTETEIKKAYYKMAAIYHPDKAGPEGREMFEKIQTAYQFLTSKSFTDKRKDNRPNRISIIVRAQCVLYERYPQVLAPYKYSGYPLMRRILDADADPIDNFGAMTNLTSVPVEATGGACQATIRRATLLGSVTELIYLTCRAAPLNSQELVREGLGSQIAVLFERMNVQMSKNTPPVMPTAVVSQNLLRTFAIMCAYDLCRDALIPHTPVFYDIVRSLDYTSAPRTIQCAMECMQAMAVDPRMQNALFDCGAIWRVCLFLFDYDFTLDESAVERKDDSNAQEMQNNLAKVAIRTLSRLAGLPAPQTPPPAPAAQLQQKPAVPAADNSPLSSPQQLATLSSPQQLASLPSSPVATPSSPALSQSSSGLAAGAQPVSASGAVLPPLPQRNLPPVPQAGGAAAAASAAPGAAATPAAPAAGATPVGPGALVVATPQLPPPPPVRSAPVVAASAPVPVLQILPLALSLPVRLHTESARALDRMFSNYLVHMMRDPARYNECLKLLNSNVENPYLIWNIGCRAELRVFLDGEIAYCVRRGTRPEIPAVEKLVYSAHQGELKVGGIYLRVYNKMPTFPIDRPEDLCRCLSDYLCSRFPTADRQDIGSWEAARNDCAIAVQALRNLVRAYFRLAPLVSSHIPPQAASAGAQDTPLYLYLSAMLRCAEDGEMQFQALSLLTELCVSDVCIASITKARTIPSDLMFLLRTRRKALDGVLACTIALSSHTDFVIEALRCGVPVYLLEVFLHDQLEMATRASVAVSFSKMLADRLHGPRVHILLEKFLPFAFLTELKACSGEGSSAVRKLDEEHENPELIWNSGCRKECLSTVSNLTRDLFARQQESRSNGKEPAPLELPEHWRVTYTDIEGKLFVGGVYVHLYLRQTSYPLRSPREFLVGLMDALASRLTGKALAGGDLSGSSSAGQPASSSQALENLEEILKDLRTALVVLLRTQHGLAAHVAALGHIPRLVQLLDSQSTTNVHAMGTAVLILHALSDNQQCADTCCAITSFCRALIRSSRISPTQLMPLAIECFNRVLKANVSAGRCPRACLVDQANEAGVQRWLLNFLESGKGEVEDPSTVSAHASEALKLMAADVAHGQRTVEMLNASPFWSQYKDQRHDLFVSARSKAPEMLMGSTSVGLITDGRKGEQK